MCFGECGFVLYGGACLVVACERGIEPSGREMTGASRGDTIPIVDTDTAFSRLAMESIESLLGDLCSRFDRDAAIFKAGFWMQFPLQLPSSDITHIIRFPDSVLEKPESLINSDSSAAPTSNTGRPCTLFHQTHRIALIESHEDGESNRKAARGPRSRRGTHRRPPRTLRLRVQGRLSLRVYEYGTSHDGSESWYEFPMRLLVGEALITPSRGAETGTERQGRGGRCGGAVDHFDVVCGSGGVYKRSCGVEDCG